MFLTFFSFLDLKISPLSRLLATWIQWSHWWASCLPASSYSSSAIATNVSLMREILSLNPLDRSLNSTGESWSCSIGRGKAKHNLSLPDRATQCNSLACQGFEQNLKLHELQLHFSLCLARLFFDLASDSQLEFSFSSLGFHLSCWYLAGLS